MKVKCVDIFKIEYNKHEYYAYEFSMYCKRKKLLEQEEIKKANIIYDTKKMSYEEHIQDLIKKSKEFKADRADTQYISAPEFVFLYDYNLYVCLKYLGSLCSNITAANHYALQSYEKLPFDLHGTKNYMGCFFRRCLDFSTSVLWYNSAIDYFLQIFCSRFDIYSEITKRDVKQMSFEEISSLCDYSKVLRIMRSKEKNAENKDIFIWWKNINECRTKLSWIREIANSLKHKSGVVYNGIDLTPLIEIQKGTKKMSVAYLPKRIDIDADYKKVIESHNEIVRIYSYIVKEINKEIDIKKLDWDKKIIN